MSTFERIQGVKAPTHTSPPVPGRGQAILQMICAVTSPVGAEIGVHKGVLSEYLLTNRPDLTLFMVDSWAQFDSDAYRATKDSCASFTQRQQDQFFIQAYNTNKRHIESARAIVLKMDSLAAAEQMDDESLDFVFIDAEHSYEGCKRDIQAWLPKVKPGGWLCGHDYNNTQFPQFGVSKAVHDVLGDSIILGIDFTWFWRKLTDENRGFRITPAMTLT